MGIRFLCENCQKRLNVKAHQAGKSGKCPHCGKPIVVPLKSTLAEASDKPRGDDFDTQPTTQFGQTRRFDSDELGGTMTQAKPVRSTLDEFVIPSDEQECGSDDSITLSSGDIPVADDSSFLLGKPKNPALQPGGPNPIDEDPSRVWYIRHPREAEVGPIRGKQFRELMEQGKIKPGSYIWREDWQDWEKIGDVFTQYAVPDAEIADRVFSDASYPLPTPVSQVRAARRRIWLTVAIVVSVVTIGLLIYFLIQSLI